MDLVMPVLMGLERVCADEILEMGFPEEDITLEDALVRLRLSADINSISPYAFGRTIARLNLRLATAGRVELEVARFEATDFDSFFDMAASLPWETLIPPGAAFTVKGYSRNSQLYSTTDLQRLLKKAVVNRLLERRYRGESVVPESETKGLLSLRFAFFKDICSLRVDTTGDSLHKRGYRPAAGEAPLSEMLAAALVRIVRWKPFSGEALVDPFCGSGTIAIEAAMMAASIAPGLGRSFAAEKWMMLNEDDFAAERAEARAEIDSTPPDEPFIFGMDIDPAMVRLSRENAERAGVSRFIVFSQGDARSLTKEKLDSLTKSARQQVLGNPPYGERMQSEREVQDLHYALGTNLLLQGAALPQGLRIGIITSDEDFEYDFGRVADKRRKLYNGMIKTTFYQYFREQPRQPRDKRGRK